MWIKGTARTGSLLEERRPLGNTWLRRATTLGPHNLLAPDEAASHTLDRPATSEVSTGALGQEVIVMLTRDQTKGEEASEAAWEAGRGAVSGGLKWGTGAAILAAIGQKTYPLYRNLTIQFKVYIQFSAMIMGGMIEADNRLRIYENRKRLQRRMAREQAKWDRYEQEFLEGKDKK